MCIGCWHEMGRPAAFTATTMQTADAVRRLYEINAVGGDAHIVTDDWNLDDDNVAWCIRHLGNYHDAPEEIAAARVVLNLLRPMTEAERATVLAVWEGFLRPTTNDGSSVSLRAHGDDAVRSRGEG